MIQNLNRGIGIRKETRILPFEEGSVVEQAASFDEKMTLSFYTRSNDRIFISMV